MGVDFGWIGNPNCKSKCPNDCPSKTWKYWKGKTGGKGRWYVDTQLEIKGNNLIMTSQLSRFISTYNRFM